jgi:hypothetical protein
MMKIDNFFAELKRRSITAAGRIKANVLDKNRYVEVRVSR